MDQKDIPHSNKKVIFFAIGAISLVFLSLFLAYLTVGSSTNNTSKDIEGNTSQLPSDGTKSNDTEKRQTASSIDPTPVSGWKAYRSEKFIIHHPANWQVSELVLSGGKTGVGIKPLVNNSNANFVVSVEPRSSAQKFKNTLENYKALGFTQTSVRVSNLTGTRISGSFSPKSASASANVNAIHTVYVVLDKGNETYAVDFSYSSPRIDNQLELTVKEMIDSLRIL
jgi:hypothetical protein